MMATLGVLNEDVKTAGQTVGTEPTIFIQIYFSSSWRQYCHLLEYMPALAYLDHPRHPCAVRLLLKKNSSRLSTPRRAGQPRMCQSNGNEYNGWNVKQALTHAFPVIQVESHLQA